jgi:hypothetical protein
MRNGLPNHKILMSPQTPLPAPKHLSNMLRISSDPKLKQQKIKVVMVDILWTTISLRYKMITGLIMFKLKIGISQ